MTPKTTEIDALETSISEAENAVNEYLSAGTVKDHMRNLIKAARSHLATLKAEPQDGETAYLVKWLDAQISSTQHCIELTKEKYAEAGYSSPFEGQLVMFQQVKAALSRAALTPESEGIARVESRDWTEDFSHENGNYSCQCCQCNQTFVGHKRMVVCKLCALSTLARPQEIDVESLVNEVTDKICTNPEHSKTGMRLVVSGIVQSAIDHLAASGRLK